MLQRIHLEGENVAPRAGAWIETMLIRDLKHKRKVAPRAGAFETANAPKTFRIDYVAPRAGAWIETIAIREHCFAQTD